MRKHIPFPGFSNVSRPSRYIGGEVGSVRKDPARVKCRIALAFPDVYEIGMSHLGYSIVYHGFNNIESVCAERVFAPWFDAGKELEKAGKKLATLETGTPLSNFDVIGFTLSHELAATNILYMLDLGGIPVLAAERTEEHPIVIAGGCAAANPEPLADFIDAFYLGDAEPALSEIADAVIEGKEKGRSRADMLESLAHVEGIYIPSFYQPHCEDGKFAGMLTRAQSFPAPRRRIAHDLSEYPLPERPVVPFVDAVHNRVTVEVARGCTRGCRFCVAGMYYRPVRERAPQAVFDYACRALDRTGHEDVSLMALTTGDYTRIGETLRAIFPECKSRKVEISLPSMRFGTLEKSLAGELSEFRKSGFTLAPEAGTERLRAVINKVIDEEKMIEEVRALADSGWRQFKLYFIIGLPTETDEDIEAIAELSRRIKEAAGRKAKVTASASTFVPKPFTPFEWEPMLDVEEIIRRQKLLKKNLRGSGVKWKYHDPRLSVAEGVLARGGRECGKLIHNLHRRGVKFCAWTDYFDEVVWNEEIVNAGIDLQAALGPREVSAPLPWDHLDMRIDRKFLETEREKAHRAAVTEDCRVGGCVDCGACGNGVDVKLAVSAPEISQPSKPEESLPETETPFRYRISYRKFGRIIFLGHLELKSVFEKALRRAKLPVRFSGGYHPQIRIVFSPPLPVGIASDAELVDVFLNEKVQPDEIKSRLSAELPEGIEITAVSAVPLRSPSLQQAITEISYIADLSSSELDMEEILESISYFQLDGPRLVERRPGDTKPVVIHDHVKNLKLSGNTLEFSVLVLDGRTVRPGLVLEVAAGLDEDRIAKINIIKTGVRMEENPD